MRGPRGERHAFMQAKRCVSALQCRQSSASTASCPRQRQFAVAQTSQKGDPGLKIAGNPANVGPMRRAAQWDGVFPLKLPPGPLAEMRPGAVPWSILWLQPHELAGAVQYVRQHRTNSAPFDVIASGATPLGDQTKGKEIVSAFREAGATWWLEWLDEQRGTFAQMREHIRKGPPNVG